MNKKYEKLKERYIYLTAFSLLPFAIINSNLMNLLRNNYVVALTLSATFLGIIGLIVAEVVESSGRNIRLSKIINLCSTATLITMTILYISICPSITSILECHGFLNATPIMGHSFNVSGFLILVMAGLSTLGSILLIFTKKPTLNLCL